MGIRIIETSPAQDLIIERFELWKSCISQQLDGKVFIYEEGEYEMKLYSIEPDGSFMIEKAATSGAWETEETK